MAAAGTQQQHQELCWVEAVLDERQADTGVRVMHLNAPGSLNSLTPAMAEQFEAALAALAADAGARALVLTGEGRAFSAGGDYTFIQQRMAGTVEGNKQVLLGFYATFLALRSLPIVTIAAINGPAVGGGAGLAMSADMRLASRDASICFNFVTLGLSPGMASSVLLPAATSHQVACRLLLTGDRVSADEAAALGLVLDVLPQDELLPAALALARRVAAASPAAVAATLRMLRAGLRWEELAAAAAREAAVQAGFFNGHDIQEGLAATREKRPPRFAGCEVQQQGGASGGAVAGAHGVAAADAAGS